MPQLLVCPRGHHWDPAAASSSGGESEAPVCPVCGAREAVLTDTVDTSPASEMTLAAPPRAPRAAPPPDESGPTVMMPVKPTALPAGDAYEASDQTLPTTAGDHAGPASDQSDLTLASPGSAPRPPAIDATLPLPSRAPQQPPSPVSDSSLPPLSATLPARAGWVGAKHLDATAPLAAPPSDETARDAGADAEESGIDAPTFHAKAGTHRARPAGRTQGAKAPVVGSSTRAGTAAADDSGFSVGPAIPGYRVLGELGRGGMGVVYKAEQIGLNRLVAVKMILSGDYAAQEDLIRFRLEAEAVAKLQHPYIVQVFEIDEVDGRPFFCLEFVGGGALDKKLAGTPQPFRQAAELMEKLARAMAYAHERNIIHRDLKPPNILLTSDGSPKITDFGLAKKLDDKDSQTQSGSVMGTPSYMAPEQAHGRTRDIGPAADIYSLGAILYETLVGRPPFKGETILDTLDQVRNLEPAPPSRLRPKLPRDLETICLKCLQKEPSKRYATAGALAEDLRRYQAGEPILARPTPIWERAIKWARRRPVAAALAGVVALFVLSLIGGGAAFATYYRWQAAEQTRLRNQAETDLEHSHDAVGRFLTDVGETLANVPQSEGVRRKLLADALEFNKKFLAESSSDPVQRRATGRAYIHAGDMENMLGKQAEAEQSYASGREILTALRGEFPDDARYQRDLAVCWNNLGALLLDEQRAPEAEKAFHEALALLQQLVDQPVQGAADAQDDRQKLAGVASYLGIMLKEQGRYAEAESFLKQTLDLCEGLYKANVHNPVYRLDLAHIRDNLGLFLGVVGHMEEADRACRDANIGLINLRSENADVPAYQLELAMSYKNLGDLWRDTNPELAAKEYNNALYYCDQLVLDYPTTAIYRQRLGELYHNLGLTHQAAGRQEEAEQAYDQAQAAEEKLVADFPSVPVYQDVLAEDYNNRGILMQNNNRREEAEKWYGKALTLMEKLAAQHPDAPQYQQDLANTLQNLGVLYFFMGRADDSAKALDRALGLRRKLADDHPLAPIYQQRLAEAHHNLGAAAQLNGKLKDAEGRHRQAVDLLAQLAEQHPEVPDYRHLYAVASRDLGIVLRDGQTPGAEKPLRKAVDLLTALKDEQPTVPIYRQELARTLNELGILLASTDRAADAEKAWGQALELQEKLAGDFPNNPVYRQEWAKYDDNLGILEAQAGRLNQAEKSYRQAAELLEGLAKEDPDNPVYWADLIAPYSNLVNLLTAEGSPNEEIGKCWARLADLMRKLAAGSPKDAEQQSQTGLTLSGQAAFLRKARQPAEARDALKEAVRLQRAALDAQPQNADYRLRLCDAYLLLAQTLLDLNDHGATADAVAELVKAEPAAWPNQLAAACLARAAALAAKDDKLPPEKRDEEAKAYADRAMDLLRQAVKDGFKDVKYLDSTRDFDAVRLRDDFKKLTADLEKK